MSPLRHTSLLLSFCLLVPDLVSSSNSIPKYSAANGVYWEEELPLGISSTDCDNDDEYDFATTDHAKNGQEQDRQIVLWGPLKFARPRMEHKVLCQKSPHPLRTNLWRVNFTWRDRRFIPDQTIIMEFDPRGYCRVTNQQHGANNITATMIPSCSRRDNPNQDPMYQDCVGTWNMIPSGVLWNFSKLQFWAEVHLQPFANHPRMFRGVIVRERYVCVVYSCGRL